MKIRFYDVGTDETLDCDLFFVGKDGNVYQDSANTYAVPVSDVGWEAYQEYEAKSK